MDLQSAQVAVLAFHNKFGHPVGQKPRVIKDIPYVDRMFRIERIEEETKELIQAIRFGDTPHAIQEAMDLLYVTLGLLVLLGVPVEPFFEAVHNANMEKVPHPLGSQGKPLKPEGWESPKRRIYVLFEQMLAEAAKPEVDMDFPLEKPPIDPTVPGPACGLCGSDEPGHDHGAMEGGFSDEDPSVTGLAEFTQEDGPEKPVDPTGEPDPHDVMTDEGNPHTPAAE